MYRRISSGPANRCVRSQDNQVRQGDSGRKAGRRAARTFATMTELHATGEASARLSAQPLCRKWTPRLSVSCDKKLDTSWEVPFGGTGLAIEVMRPLQKTSS